MNGLFKAVCFVVLWIQDRSRNDPRFGAHMSIVTLGFTMNPAIFYWERLPVSSLMNQIQNHSYDTAVFWQFCVGGHEAISHFFAESTEKESLTIA